MSSGGKQKKFAASLATCADGVLQSPSTEGSGSTCLDGDRTRPTCWHLGSKISLPEHFRTVQTRTVTPSLCFTDEQQSKFTMVVFPAVGNAEQISLRLSML